jgi:Cu+-exporting ATPase
MMNARHYPLNGLEKEVERLQSEAKTAMLVVVDGAVRGVIAVADTVKDGSREAIDELHRMGLKVAIIYRRQPQDGGSHSKTSWH